MVRGGVRGRRAGGGVQTQLAQVAIIEGSTSHEQLASWVGVGVWVVGGESLKYPRRRPSIYTVNTRSKPMQKGLGGCGVFLRDSQF